MQCWFSIGLFWPEGLKNVKYEKNFKRRTPIEDHTGNEHENGDMLYLFEDRHFTHFVC